MNPLARYTSGQVRVMREQIELEFRLTIGKPLRKLREAETATLHALFEQAGVGLETVALHELPVNRAERRRIIKHATNPVVIAHRKAKAAKRKHRTCST